MAAPVRPLFTCTRKCASPPINPRGLYAYNNNNFQTLFQGQIKNCNLTIMLSDLHDKVKKGTSVFRSIAPWNSWSLQLWHLNVLLNRHFQWYMSQDGAPYLKNWSFPLFKRERNIISYKKTINDRLGGDVTFILSIHSKCLYIQVWFSNLYIMATNIFTLIWCYN